MATYRAFKNLKNERERCENIAVALIEANANPDINHKGQGPANYAARFSVKLI